MLTYRGSQVIQNGVYCGVQFGRDLVAVVVSLSLATSRQWQATGALSVSHHTGAHAYGKCTDVNTECNDTCSNGIFFASHHTSPGHDQENKRLHEWHSSGRLSCSKIGEKYMGEGDNQKRTNQIATMLQRED